MTYEFRNFQLGMVSVSGSRFSYQISDFKYPIKAESVSYCVKVDKKGKCIAVVLESSRRYSMTKLPGAQSLL